MSENDTKNLRIKRYGIIGIHIFFIIAFPISLYQKYGEVNMLKVSLAGILLLISMICLFVSAGRFKVITRDWFNVAVFTIISIVLSFTIFGKTVAWMIQRF